MAYKLKGEFWAGGQVYPRGSVLPANTSKNDLDFLKKKKLVETVGVPENTDGGEGGIDVGAFPGLGRLGLQVQKSVDEIRKMNSKQEVAAYAASIGYEMGRDFKERRLKDLQDEVINFQEEMDDM